MLAFNPVLSRPGWRKSWRQAKPQQRCARRRSRDALPAGSSSPCSHMMADNPGGSLGWGTESGLLSTTGGCRHRWTASGTSGNNASSTTPPPELLRASPRRWVHSWDAISTPAKLLFATRAHATRSHFQVGDGEWNVPPPPLATLTWGSTADSQRPRAGAGRRGRASSRLGGRDERRRPARGLGSFLRGL